VQYEGHEPVIYGNKSGFDKDAIQVLKTDAPYVADKIMQYKHDLWNEVMSFLGVGNAKQDKKERLVAAEVSANDEQIEMAREIMLKARQDACEKINKMFGTNISVKFKTFDDDIIEDNPEEGIENG
jgi:metal-dependent amidase/aminoacylase/carboxypeptidase family protein